MTNTLLLKRSGVANAVPSSGNLTQGELALNYQDGNLFYRDSGSNVRVLASTQFVSVTGNITGGNVSASGNVSGTYILGDGSLLTNIVANVNVTEIANGNSNVRIATANGNATVAIAGLDNSSLFSKGSLFTSGPFSTPKTVNNQSLMANDVNGKLFGSLTIGPSGNVFVPATSTLQIGDTTVLSGNLQGNLLGNGFGAANLAFVSAVGNVTGNYFIGNGSLLTGIAAGGGNTTVSPTAPVGPSQGDIWIDSATGFQYIYFTASGNSQWAEMEADVSFSSTSLNFFSGVNSNIIPSANVTFDLGNTNFRWKDIWLANSTIYLGATQISANGANLVLGNVVTSTIYLGATQISANGANLVLGNVVTLGNVTLLASGPNLVTESAISATGNVTGGNVLTAGAISATGNVTGGNVSAAGLVSVLGNVTGGNVLTTGQITATGNVTGGNLVTSGSISATGSISTAANATANNLSAGNLAVSGTANLGAINLAGSIIPTANVTYNLGSSTNRFNDIWLANSTIYLGSAQISANATAITLSNPAGGNMVLAGATSDLSANIVSASGNITGGNLTTAGSISATGNVTGNTYFGNGAFNSFQYDDISSSTNGTKGTFALRYNQTNLSVTDPFALDVAVNGMAQPTFIWNSDVIWQTFALGTFKGYTIISSGNITFTTPPLPNSDVVIKTSSGQAVSNTKRYPFLPADIMLGT